MKKDEREGKKTERERGTEGKEVTLLGNLVRKETRPGELLGEEGKKGGRGGKGGGKEGCWAGGKKVGYCVRYGRRCSLYYLGEK